VSADALMIFGVVVLPAVLIGYLWAYTLGAHRGRKHAVRMQNEVVDHILVPFNEPQRWKPEDYD
jgi:hypothetical protein